MQNAPERLFADSEVIDLCQSVINIHRALKSLSQFFGDLEDPPGINNELSGNAFVFWGLQTLAERFLTDQNLKLTRIMEIYKIETDKLVQRTAERR